MDGAIPSPLAPAPASRLAAFDRALSDHLAGHLREAETGYRRVLDGAPRHAAALHFLGVLLHQQGRSDEGIALVRESLAASPDESDWHNTLGNMLSATGQDAEAVAAFMAALEVDARHAHAWNNLGALLLRNGQAGEAIRAFDNAVTIDSAFEDAWYNLGDAQARVGDEQAAAVSRCAAYVLRPLADKPRHMLGVAFSVLGRFDDAARMYEQWLVQEPGHPVASHLLAAARGGAAPERASNAYLQAYFDGLADSFDHKLLGTLHYSVPALIGQVLRERGVPPHSLRILDAGCGTGLCGQEVAPHARTLIGVDLSARSLELAAGKGVYSALQQQEVVAHMADGPGAAYDLVLAADTLIYFGDINGFLHAAVHSLAAGGQLIASFEELAPAGGDGAGPSHAITPSGRYSHRRSHVLERLRAAGFEAPEVTDIDIRNELARPVTGFLVVARRRC